MSEVLPRVDVPLLETIGVMSDVLNAHQCIQIFSQFDTPRKLGIHMVIVPVLSIFKHFCIVLDLWHGYQAGTVKHMIFIYVNILRFCYS